MILQSVTMILLHWRVPCSTESILHTRFSSCYDSTLEYCSSLRLLFCFDLHWGLKPTRGIPEQYSLVLLFMLQYLRYFGVQFVFPISFQTSLELPAHYDKINLSVGGEEEGGSTWCHLKVLIKEIVSGSAANSSLPQ